MRAIDMILSGGGEVLLRNDIDQSVPHRQSEDREHHHHHLLTVTGQVEHATFALIHFSLHLDTFTMHCYKLTVHCCILSVHCHMDLHMHCYTLSMHCRAPTVRCNAQPVHFNTVFQHLLLYRSALSVLG